MLHYISYKYKNIHSFLITKGCYWACIIIQRRMITESDALKRNSICNFREPSRKQTEKQPGSTIERFLETCNPPLKSHHDELMFIVDAVKIQFWKITNSQLACVLHACICVNTPRKTGLTRFYIRPAIVQNKHEHYSIGTEAIIDDFY